VPEWVRYDRRRRATVLDCGVSGTTVLSRHAGPVPIVTFIQED